MVAASTRPPQHCKTSHVAVRDASPEAAAAYAERTYKFVNDAFGAILAHGHGAGATAYFTQDECICDRTCADGLVVALRAFTT